MSAALIELDAFVERTDPAASFYCYEVVGVGSLAAAGAKHGRGGSAPWVQVVQCREVVFGTLRTFSADELRVIRAAS